MPQIISVSCTTCNAVDEMLSFSVFMQPAARLF
jgi:hypothetical protein